MSESRRKQFRYDDLSTVISTFKKQTSRKPGVPSKNITNNPKNKPYSDRRENQAKIKQLAELDFTNEANRKSMNVCDVPERQDIPKVVQAISYIDLMNQLNVKVCKMVEGSDTPVDVRQVFMIEKALMSGPNPLSKSQLDRLKAFMVKNASRKHPVAFTTDVPKDIVQITQKTQQGQQVQQKSLSLKEKLKLVEKTSSSAGVPRSDEQEQTTDSEENINSAVTRLKSDLASNRYNIALEQSRLKGKPQRLMTINTNDVLPFETNLLSISSQGAEKVVSLITTIKLAEENMQLALRGTAIISSDDESYTLFRSSILSGTPITDKINPTNLLNYTKSLIAAESAARSTQTNSLVFAAKTVVDAAKRANTNEIATIVADPILVNYLTDKLLAKILNNLRKAAENLTPGSKPPHSIVFVFTPMSTAMTRQQKRNIVLLKIIPASHFNAVMLQKQMQHSLSDYLSPQKKEGAERRTSKTIQSIPRELLATSAIPFTYLPALTRPGKKGKRRGRRLSPLSL